MARREDAVQGVSLGVVAGGTAAGWLPGEVRRAIADEPQLVTRNGRDAVVVVGAEEYRRLAAPRNLLDFLRDRPFTEAVAEGDLDLERPPDYGRDVPL